MYEQRGFLDGEWYMEEHPGRTRLGLHVKSLLHEESSPFQSLKVYDTSFFGRLLTLDDLVMLTERDEFVYHEMLTHVPLLSLPEPRSVLIIGGGDCGCAREALRHPVERVVQCEIDERVTRVCERYFDWVPATLEDPRFEAVFEDGVAYLERTGEQFDLVVVDSTDPIGPAAALFQQPFYVKVRSRLTPGGVMVAQTESPHWGPEVVGQVYRELRATFPEVHGYLGSIPTYPSGSWSWVYASSDRRPHDHFDETRATELEPGCRYHNRDIQTGAFLLPAFVRRAMAGEDPFSSISAR